MAHDGRVKNDGFDYRGTTDADADGVPLSDYLGRRFPHTSAEEWARRAAEGFVLLDGITATARTLLRRGQRLVWRRPAWEEPDAPLEFAVLYDDGDLLAVAKPAGLPTLPGAGHLHATLLYRVRRYAAEAAPLHRLGRWTSGVVLFARDPRTRTAMARRWAAGEIEKRYRALAVGAPSVSGFTVEVPIGPVPYAPLGTVHAASAAGKPASSRVAVLERREGAFLCDVHIATGRPHQIRIHLAAAGHPLLGDPLYGPGGVPIPGSRSVPGDPGYRLHAAEIGFPHPREAKFERIRCAPPPVLRTAPVADAEGIRSASDV